MMAVSVANRRKCLVTISVPLLLIREQDNPNARSADLVNMEETSSPAMTQKVNKRQLVREPKRSRVLAAYLGAVIALVVICLLSLGIGAKSMSFSELADVLVGSASAGNQQIVFGLRFDRTVTGLLVGAALGASGAIMQSVIRNPIADPGILGINAGAALGVAIGILCVGSAGAMTSIFFSLGGSIFAALFLFVCASLPSFRNSAVRITLCGVAFSALLAGITQTLILADENLLDQFRFWQVGSLSARPLSIAAWVAPLIIFGLIFAWLIGQRLNVLDLGDESSTALGARATKTRLGALLLVALLCGPATALAGPVAFVGFAVPHLVRLITGHDTKQVIRFSALVAPVLLLACDILGRVIGSGAEVQVGIMTAVIGSVLLMILILRRSSRNLS